MGDYDDDFSGGDYSSDDDYDNSSDEQESDEHYDNRDQNADADEAPVHYPLNDWEDIAMLGAISEEIADERRRRYQDLKEDGNPQKRLHNGSAWMNSAYGKESNTKKQVVNAVPKVGEQIYKAQNESNVQVVINIAIFIFIIVMLARACSG